MRYAGKRLNYSMTRRVLNLLTALSLLLCVAACVLWVRSYWVADHFWLAQRRGSTQMLRAARGDVEFMAERRYYIDVSRFPRLTYEHSVGTYLGVTDPARDYSRHGKWLFVRWGGRAGQPEPTAEQLRSDREALLALAGDIKQLRERAEAGDRDAPRVRENTVRRARELEARPGYRWTVQFPAWILVALSAVLPAVWLWRAVRLRLRPRAGHCRRCGYDLRATPDRCPECGEVTPKPA
jgi:hypothetical protein